MTYTPKQLDARLRKVSVSEVVIGDGYAIIRSFCRASTMRDIIDFDGIEGERRLLAFLRARRIIIRDDTHTCRR